jgi:hypothetical protein
VYARILVQYDSCRDDYLLTLFEQEFWRIRVARIDSRRGSTVFTNPWSVGEGRRAKLSGLEDATQPFKNHEVPERTRGRIVPLEFLMVEHAAEPQSQSVLGE